MNPNISRQLRRLLIQGTENIDQETTEEVGNWLRLATAVCATLAALGTIFASPTFLFALVPIAAAAAIFKTHPADYLYNHVIRRFTGTRPLPKRGIPTRLACGIGGSVITAAAFAFSSGNLTLGYILGGQIVLVAGLAATTDICLPSVLYQLSIGRSDLVKGLFD
ncbi:MAG: DUF4395 family protein [Chloroflexota bacterium]